MSNLNFIPPVVSSKSAPNLKTSLFSEKTTTFGTISFDRFLKEADERRFQTDQFREKAAGFGLDESQVKTELKKDEFRTVDRIDRDERGPQSKPGRDGVGGEGTKDISRSQTTDATEEKAVEKVSDETDHQNEDDSDVKQDETLVLMVQSAEAQMIIEGGIQPETILTEESNDITGVELVETVQTGLALAGDEVVTISGETGEEAIPLDAVAAKVETVKSHSEAGELSNELEQIHQVLTSVSTDATPSQMGEESLGDQGRNPNGHVQVFGSFENVGVEVVGENQDEMVSDANTQSLKPEIDVDQLAKQTSNSDKEGKVNLAVIQTQLAVNDGPKAKAEAEPQVLGVVPTQPGFGSSSSNQVSGPGEVPVANKEELFSQIVEYAKVMVNGGGSEMEISLKPEHLGKLQLKVTIENEIVTAKFIAESQQVKEVIESNLGQLKRDLQANGMQVDTILVSVGYQQGNEGFEQASYNGERSDNFSGTGNIVADEGVLETEHPVPDLKGDRVIDLIA